MLEVEVARLLKDSNGATAFLDAPLLNRSLAGQLLEGTHTGGSSAAAPPKHAARTSSPRSESVPEQLDRFRILGQIGEGGMGSVFEAEQTAPVRRRVALKLMRSTAISGEFARRFAVKRGALARMQHSNIARVAETAAMLEIAYTQLSAAVGETHSTTISTLKHLALSRLSLGETDKSLELLDKVVRARRAAQGPMSTTLSSDLFSLATALHERPQFAAAELYYREGISIAIQTAGADTINAADPQHAFASMLLSAALPADAESFSREALRVRLLRLGESHTKVAQSRNVLGGILIALGRFGKAEPLLSQAWPILRDRTGVNPGGRLDCAKRMLAKANHQSDAAGAAEWTRQLGDLSRSSRAVIEHTAQDATDGAPAALQIADRFRLHRIARPALTTRSDGAARRSIPSRSDLVHVPPVRKRRYLPAFLLRERQSARNALRSIDRR